jgi:hypothetical protein
VPASSASDSSYQRYANFFEYSGSDAGFQCVELANRYLWVADGILPISGEGLTGYDYVDIEVADGNVSSSARFYNTASSAENHPYLAGDIVSFSGYGGAGHVAVVIYSGYLPGDGGTYSVTLMEEDASTTGKTTAQVTNWVMKDPADGDVTPYDYIAPLAINNTGLPNFSKNEPYAAQLDASGGTGGDDWSITSGSLPAGLSLTAAGALSGTPTHSGSATFAVQVTDNQSDVATATFTILNQKVKNLAIESLTASVKKETVTFHLRVVDANSVGLWDGAINFVCNDPSTGEKTGTIGFIWAANPQAGQPFGIPSSLVSGTLNDGSYDPGTDVYTDATPNGAIYGTCQPFLVDVSDQDGGSATDGSGNPSAPDFPFPATFSIPQD